MERTLYGCVSVELTLEVEARAEVALRGRVEMVILSHPPGCGISLIKRAGRPSSGEAELKQRHPFKVAPKPSSVESLLLRTSQALGSATLQAEAN